MAAREWQPYLPTPPFPAYVSGHSAFTAAWARIMELATGKAEFGLRVIVRHLYVEERDLDQPVELVYPTFWAAAQASGLSRIDGGIHWPQDNSAGLELGRRVAENAWDRSQQFLLGSAFPAAAAFRGFAPAFWRVESGMMIAPSSQPVSGEALAANLTERDPAIWRSALLDPVAGGQYELRLTAVAEADGPVVLRTTIERQNGSAPVLANAETPLSSGGSYAATMSWKSDGESAFRVVIEARCKCASGQVILSRIENGRVWPQAAGAPRYWSMGSASLPTK
jgi:hypothetical protein